MPKLDDQIATLEDKLKNLKLPQQRSDERKRAIAAQRERKLDTRRKILIGGIVLTKIKDGALAESELRKWLDAALTRADDRELFGLTSEGERKLGGTG